MENITVENLLSATNGRLLSGSPSQTVNAVTTDSRQIAARKEAQRFLFVPIAGERVDAHRFLPDILAEGAAACFASAAFLKTEDGILFRDLAAAAASFCLIEVRDTLAALQASAAWYRSLFAIPVIGITGSVGKTTTKEMVAAALGSVLNVHKTAGNQNSQVGLPLTLFGLERRHQAAVIEMGMSEFGEMERIAAVAKPDHAVFTNIGVAHIGNLGSQENIRSEKLHITDFFHAGSTLVLNADDPLLLECIGEGGFLARLQEKTGCSHIPYGILDAADFRAEEIHVRGEGTDFLFRNRTDPAGKSVPIRLKTLGIHNVRNALAALGAADALGIPPETAARGLSSYRPPDMRGNLVTAGGIRILNDTYNASPDSMKSAVEVLSSLSDAGRRIVVFADILELGERSAALHREVGAFLSGHNRTNPARISLLAGVGPESAHILEGCTEDGMERKHFDSNTAAASFLQHYLAPGDVVLVKGSRGMHTEEIVSALEEHFSRLTPLSN